MNDDSTKLYVNEKLDQQQKENDQRYAMKLVERIVFGALGMVAVAVVGALLSLVIIK